MSMAPGDKEEQVVVGKDGNTYKITATMNRLEFVQLSGENTGEMSSLVYKPESRSWYHEKGCDVTKLMQYSEDGSMVSIFAADGKVATLPVSITDKDLANKMVEEQFASQTCMN